MNLVYTSPKGRQSELTSFWGTFDEVRLDFLNDRSSSFQFDENFKFLNFKLKGRETIFNNKRYEFKFEDIDSTKLNFDKVEFDIVLIKFNKENFVLDDTHSYYGKHIFFIEVTRSNDKQLAYFKKKIF